MLFPKRGEILKKYLELLVKASGLLSVLILLGAGNATVYFGIVTSIEADKITILRKNGAEIKLRIDAATKSFVSGKRLPAAFIKRNSYVQIAVDEHDVCLQIVVEGAPK